MSTSKVVIVQYHYQEAFKVPKGLDLEDKTKVTEWWVKWNTLKILLVDGTILEIQPEWDCVGDYMKHPDGEPTIEDADEFGFEEEEEEEVVTPDTIIMGVVCKKCDNVLPPHTAREHLDVTSKILECPHVDVCEKCHLIECCCEADRLQVIADDERAIADGYREINGRWIKVKR